VKLLNLENKKILITGGTGSLSKVLLRRLLAGEAGRPARIVVFSRDESKQYSLRAEYLDRSSPTHEVLYENFDSLIEFRIGDVRDLHSVAAALRGIDVVLHTAALKQVPTCEYFPVEAVQTNVLGAENIVRAIREFRLPVETVIGISTDKAASPVNVMGMTKALQERVFTRANLELPDTRFALVRYGNVLASRGSVIPLFLEQISKGGPVTITDDAMTRFVLSLDQAVDCIFAAIDGAAPGEIFVPRIRSARVMDIARALVGDLHIEIRTIGIRPGEKLHEVLVTEEEAARTRIVHGYYVIAPLLPELRAGGVPLGIQEPSYSSSQDLMSYDEVFELLRLHGLTADRTGIDASVELLR